MYGQHGVAHGFQAAMPAASFGAWPASHATVGDILPQGRAAPYPKRRSMGGSGHGRSQNSPVGGLGNFAKQVVCWGQVDPLFKITLLGRLDPLEWGYLRAKAASPDQMDAAIVVALDRWPASPVEMASKDEYMEQLAIPYRSRGEPLKEKTKDAVVAEAEALAASCGQSFRASMQQPTMMPVHPGQAMMLSGQVMHPGQPMLHGQAAPIMPPGQTMMLSQLMPTGQAMGSSQLMPTGQAMGSSQPMQVTMGGNGHVGVQPGQPPNGLVPPTAHAYQHFGPAVGLQLHVARTVQPSVYDT